MAALREYNARITPTESDVDAIESSSSHTPHFLKPCGSTASAAGTKRATEFAKILVAAGREATASSMQEAKKIEAQRAALQHEALALAGLREEIESRERETILQLEQENHELQRRVLRGRRRAGGVGVGRPAGGPVAPEGLGRVHRRAPSAGAAGATVQAVLGPWKRAAPARAHVCREPSAATLERVLLCGPKSALLS